VHGTSSTPFSWFGLKILGVRALISPLFKGMSQTLDSL